MSEFCKHNTHESQYCGACRSDMVERYKAEIEELKVRYSSANHWKLIYKKENSINGKRTEEYKAANEWKDSVNEKLQHENQALRKLVKEAIDRGLIMESCSENDWDVACDDWLKEAKEVLG